MQQTFYDTDVLSEQPMSDIMSGKEMPKEKINKKKQIYKEDLYRVFKILKTSGLSYNKPAKYDEITYTYVSISQQQFEDPDLNQSLLLENQETKKCNIGFDKQEKWIDPLLQSMKRQETSLVLQEYLKYDENQMKVLDHIEYGLFKVLDWITVIDLFQDKNYMKRIESYGKGNERYEMKDEIIIDITVSYGEQIIYQFKNIDLEIIRGLPRNVFRILKTMKDTERCICTVTDTAFRENENPEFLQSLPSITYQSHWTININLQSMLKVDDIYGDGTLTKKVYRRGINTAKPEKVSEISFHLWIFKNDKDDKFQFQEDKVQILIKRVKLIYSSSRNFPNSNYQTTVDKTDQDEELQDKDKDCLKYIIDDMNISKLLRQCLLRSKKREISIFTCLQAKDMLKRGFDYDLLTNVPESIIYVLQILNFTEGKNNFTMNIDEKIEQAKRKKKYGLEFIKQLNYNKALKIFKTINAYFDYGTFSAEDKQKMEEYQLSALLNTTLCDLKLERWEELIHCTNKILQIKPQHPKAIYRKCQALKQIGEYDQALIILDQTLQRYYQQFIESEIDELSRADLQKLRIEVMKKNQGYRNQQKQAFSKLFD